MPLAENLKTILLWNLEDLDSAYGFLKHDVEEGHTNLCPDTNCFITSNRSYLESVDEFDAIIIHQRGSAFNGMGKSLFNLIFKGGNFKMKGLLISTNYLGMEKSDMPQKRKSKQYYIFWELESASYPYMDIHRLDNFFNWTMTTRQNSDIILPYGRIVQIKEHPNPGPKLDALIQDFGLKNQHLAHNRSKIPKAAWFVSNCVTQSRRESLVKELATLMSIDVYGNCSKLYNKDSKEKSCNKSDEFNGSKDGCYKMLEKNYRFYLSFENSLCQDYVTEKFFKPMEHDVLPISLNGADMNQISPPHSSINILDFNSTLDLIDYLEKLSNDNALYASYFWWKDYYEVQNDLRHRAQSYCDLCAKLNNPQEPSKMYNDMYQWWVNESNCHNYEKDICLSNRTNCQHYEKDMCLGNNSIHIVRYCYLLPLTLFVLLLSN